MAHECSLFTSLGFCLSLGCILGIRELAEPVWRLWMVTLPPRAGLRWMKSSVFGGPFVTNFYLCCNSLLFSLGTMRKSGCLKDLVPILKTGDSAVSWADTPRTLEGPMTWVCSRGFVWLRTREQWSIG